MKRFSLILLLLLTLAALVGTLAWYAQQPGTAIAGLNSYTVQSGDSLAEIAAAHDTTTAELVALNADRYPSLETDPGQIEPGWVLTLPEGAKGDVEGTLWRQIAARTKGTVKAWVDEQIAALRARAEAAPGVYTGASPVGTSPVSGGGGQSPVSGEIVVGDAEAEQAILEMINQERSNLGLSPLTMDEGLRARARERSRDMLERGYYSHYDPVTGEPFLSVGGEVIAKGRTVDAYRGWWTSPGHYEVITHNALHRIGIGVVYGSSVIITAQLLP